MLDVKGNRKENIMLVTGIQPYSFSARRHINPNNKYCSGNSDIDRIKNKAINLVRKNINDISSWTVNRPEPEDQPYYISSVIDKYNYKLADFLLSNDGNYKEHHTGRTKFPIYAIGKLLYTLHDDDWNTKEFKRQKVELAFTCLKKMLQKDGVLDPWKMTSLADILKLTYPDNMNTVRLFCTKFDIPPVLNWRVKDALKNKSMQEIRNFMNKK